MTATAVLITGCSTGIGHATAVRLARRTDVRRCGRPAGAGSST